MGNGNAAIDYDRMEALDAARMQPPKAEDFNVSQRDYSNNYFRVPQSGHSDNYNQQTDKNENNEQSHTERLEKARVGNLTKSKIEKAKNITNLTTPLGAVSLLGQINFLSDIPYAAALGAAMLKDLVDLAFIGSLPGIGTVITICCSIFIAMMFFLAGISEGTIKKARRLAKGKAFQKTVIRMLAIITGTTIEFLPGIDFFPVESAIVVIVYTWTLMDRKNS